MITNRELTMDDYLAMLRRRGKYILIPALLGPLLGYLAYLPVKKYWGKYTSSSIVLVEGQKVPENMVQPVVSDDLQARIGMLRTVATSDSEMRPVLQNLFPNRSSGDIDGTLEDMRSQPQLVGTPFADLSQLTGSSVKKKPGQSESPGFMVSFTASDPATAREVCEALTSKIIQKNLEFIQANAKGTVDVLHSGLEAAQARLTEADDKLTAFKKAHPGQLPTDQDNNFKSLMALAQQQDRFTQEQSAAQQDRSYNQTQLVQQLGAWKSSQMTTNPQTLQKQLSDLQAQLLDLKARYTDDHPDVVKTKADIAEVKKKLAEINKASEEATDAGTDKASAMEPIEIRQLRQQIHKDDEAIAEATRELKRISVQMAQYQSHMSMSPEAEGTYKELTRNYESAAKSYQDLLADQNKASLTENMTNQAQGERMREIQPASLPDTPSFPNIFIFIGGGLAAGLALGMGLALWLELRDNSIRTEADAEAALELPMLVAVPWVGVAAGANGNGKFWRRKQKDLETEKETLTV
jgi:protein tyrosine kinase modulator